MNKVSTYNRMKNSELGKEMLSFLKNENPSDEDMENFERLLKIAAARLINADRMKNSNRRKQKFYRRFRGNSATVDSEKNNKAEK